MFILFYFFLDLLKVVDLLQETPIRLAATLHDDAPLARPGLRLQREQGADRLRVGLLLGDGLVGEDDDLSRSPQVENTGGRDLSEGGQKHLKNTDDNHIDVSRVFSQPFWGLAGVFYAFHCVCRGGDFPVKNAEVSVWCRTRPFIRLRETKNMKKQKNERTKNKKNTEQKHKPAQKTKTQKHGKKMQKINEKTKAKQQNMCKNKKTEKQKISNKNTRTNQKKRKQQRTKNKENETTKKICDKE